jgi:cytochrome c
MKEVYLLKHELHFIFCLLLGCTWLLGCNQPETQIIQIKKDYIRAIAGENDSIPVAIAQKGEVLIAYSDCHTCHKEKRDSVGPSFKDIATRYPVQRVYIDMLAQKVVSGGSGSWGRAVMSSHPKVPLDEAKIMVSYILSFKEN